MSGKDFDQETMLCAGPASMGDAKTVGLEGAPLGRIDQYDLLRELGGGGFGSVFLARDMVAGVDVAVKGLPPMVRNNAEELERIRENFALVSKLHHPHIAAALHLHPAKEISYADEPTRQKLRVFQGDTLMVMAYAPGVTLTKWRKQFPEGKVPVEQALEVCGQVAEALDYAHREKVAHRDVKPSNIMVETREQGSGDRGQGSGGPGGSRVCVTDGRADARPSLSVKVLDFGLAAEIRSSMSRVSQEKGDTSGTRPYMAPEQWAGKKQDGRTDQYALAVLFYELISGAVPFASVFDTGDPVIMSNVVKNEAPEPLAALTKTQNAALLRALAKEPAQRFPDCAAFLDALGGRVTRLRDRGRADARPSLARRAALWLVGAAVIAVVTILSMRSIQSHKARHAVEEQSVKLDAAQREKAAALDVAQQEKALRDKGVASPTPVVSEAPEQGMKQMPPVEMGLQTGGVGRVDSQGKKEEKKIISAEKVDPLEIRLAVEGGDKVYRGGEKMVFVTRVNQDCHLGLVCHQQDGSVVLLFPNPYHPDSMVKANEDTRIPSVVDPSFEIVVGPPYGTDRVEAIASHSKSELHALMEKTVAGNRQGYGVIGRGLFTEGIGKIEQASQGDDKKAHLARLKILIKTKE